MMSLYLRTLTLALLACNALAAVYQRTDRIVGPGFYDAFSFEDIPDPTHGRVNYVDSATARSQNLTFATKNRFILRADYKKVLRASGPGRNSVRIQTIKEFTEGVVIFNVWHMPEGCGTWPALWTVGPHWPNQGEIDILEGVNDKGPNLATLHTNAGCAMPATRRQTGKPTGNNCDVAQTSNAGCGVRMTDPKSYGPAFNRNKGGWFAMERTSTFIKVWFWPRNSSSIPSDARLGDPTIHTKGWGTPSAYFPSLLCPIRNKFGPHRIIINLTFCGDWAGSAYGSSGCPSTCNNYVNANPWAFKNAYFDFAWLKIYKPAAPLTIQDGNV